MNNPVEVYAYFPPWTEDDKEPKRSVIPPPPHYDIRPQPWDVIDAWNLNYNIGTALKYLARYRYKGAPREDLLKAINFIKRELECNYPG
jgi:hypothetical protein